MAALRKASELLEESSGDSEKETTALSLKTIWNDASTVEVTGESQRLGWFMHALTRDEWLLKLYFRVERGCFDGADLAARLGLKDVDEIDELPIYGRSERVRVLNKPAGYQEVAISVHWKREIDTPAFRQFLDEARASYTSRVESASTEVKDVSPWKVLGRKWHLMSKGFPAEKRPAWKKEVLEALFEILDELFPGGNVVWDERQFVRYRQPGSKDDVVVVTTKRRVGIDLVVTPVSGNVGLGNVASVVQEHAPQATKDGKPAMRVQFKTLEQVQAPEVRAFLKRCLES